MEIRCENKGEYLVAHLKGSLDMSAGGHLRGVEDLRSPQRDLILDLAEVDFMDSAGLGALVLVIRGHKSAGKRCLLAAPTPIVARTLKVTAIHQMAPVLTSVDQAIKSPVS
jgi:anti-anti-sigma factor